MFSLLTARDHALYRSCKSVPRLCSPLQCGQSLRRDVINFAFPPAVFFLPRAHDQPFAFEGVKRGVQRPLLELQSVVAAPLDFTGNAVAMQGRVTQHGQHKRRRIPFEQFPLLVHSHS